MTKQNNIPDVSVVIVSYNTRDLLRECLQTVYRETGLSYEVIVVDNASRDGSLEMVEREFPSAVAIQTGANLGFAAANNVAFRQARGQYVVLLNSDAFLTPDTLLKAVSLMKASPATGLAGGRLVGRDGGWQASARLFPSLLNDFLSISGLAARFPRSHFFGRADRTWADPMQAAETDWVPGAFSMIRRDVLEQVGYFDENFFLYYEEVDLCRRIKLAGYKVSYWPELEIVHIGGESSRQVQRLSLSSTGTQLTLWRMRSALIYYRKHHPRVAWLAMATETGWHRLRRLKNQWLKQRDAAAKAAESEAIAQLFGNAWKETDGGRLSPSRPW
jgi:GT2 family glycosyltransferase